MKPSFWKYILSMLLFGLNGIVASRIALSSYEIVWLRTLFGSLFLIGVFFLGRRTMAFRHHRKSFIYLILSGVSMGISWMLLYEAYQLIGVSIASLLYYCGPVIVMILSPILFRERLTRNRVISFLVVLAGVYLINGQMPQTQQAGRGILFALLSALMYSGMVIFNKKAHGITGLENASFQLLVSFLTVTVFIAFRHGLTIPADSVNWPAILTLGLVNTGVGCYLYFSSIGHLPAQTVAIFSYLELLSAVLFSVLLLREVLHPLQIAGALIMIGGAVFAQISVNKKIQSDHEAQAIMAENSTDSI
ncbi:MAG: DMT family transporter [Eubacteriales bacterium]|nr:DMT family transporter [Eubacteriales bacterium]